MYYKTPSITKTIYERFHTQFGDTQYCSGARLWKWIVEVDGVKYKLVAA